MQHFFLRGINVDCNHIRPRPHHIVRALLLEVKYARQHRALGLVQLAVRMRVHHERSQLIRRVSRNFVLHNGGHSNRAGNQIRHSVHHYHKRGENAADQSNDGNRVFSRERRMLARDCPGHELADYYMEENCQREPRRAPHHAQPNGCKGTTDPRGSSGSSSPVFVVNRHTEGGLGPRENPARQNQRNDPDQPGGNSARPILYW